MKTGGKTTVLSRETVVVLSASGRPKKRSGHQFRRINRLEILVVDESHLDKGRIQVADLLEVLRCEMRCLQNNPDHAHWKPE